MHYSTISSSSYTYTLPAWRSQTLPARRAHTLRGLAMTTLPPSAPHRPSATQSLLAESAVVVRSVMRRANRSGDTKRADGDLLLAGARLVVGACALEAEPLSLAAPRVPRDLLALVPALHEEPAARVPRK